jgi:catechol 2,3-dioxygenase-like lactoylglutathione lyase family enzyme
MDVRDVAFVVHTERFDESIAFYRDALGLEVVEEWYEGGHGAVIRLTERAVLELIELESAAAHGSVAVGLEVDDVDAVYARLAERGVPTKAPPVDAFGKRGFGTTDPNGVPVNVYTTAGAPG